MNRKGGLCMSSYLGKLDRSATIKNARNKLNDFSDLYKLLGTGVQVSGVNYERQPSSKTHYSNHALKLLEQIERKDKRFYEIETIMRAINGLDPKEGEVLFLKHIAFQNIDEISNVIGRSRSSVYEILNNAYFNIAILLELEVEVGKTLEKSWKNSGKIKEKIW